MPTGIEPQIRIFVPSDLEASAGAPQSLRIPALDFTKGTLVLLMVLYHWVNYFIGPQWQYYKYLRFLTLSFIFISGFMVSNVYLSKYAAADPRLPKRLLTRGLKLMAVFLFLNLARTVVIPFLGTGALIQNPFTLENTVAVFVTGNLPIVGGKLVSFSILVPISYLLIISGALMLLYRFQRYTFHFVCVLLFSSVLLSKLANTQITNLESITVGMLGVLTGFVPIAKINAFIRRPYALTCAYLGYTTVISIWNVPFFLQIVGVLLSLAVIYLLGASGTDYTTIRGAVMLLGKYSLFGYISQIAILQILRASFHSSNLGFTSLVISFFAAFVFTIMSVEVVDRARATTVVVDKMYKAVFA